MQLLVELISWDSLMHHDLISWVNVCHFREPVYCVGGQYAVECGFSFSKWSIFCKPCLNGALLHILINWISTRFSADWIPPHQKMVETQKHILFPVIFLLIQNLIR